VRFRTAAGCAIRAGLVLAVMLTAGRELAAQGFPLAPGGSDAENPPPTGPAARSDAGAADTSGIATAPVELDGTVLFRVRGVSSLPAAERAGLIRSQLIAVARDESISLDAIQVVESPRSSRIQAGEHVIASVVDADAALEQVGRIELAAAHVRRIREVLASYRDARSPGSLRRDFARAAAATLALVVGFFVVLRLWRWTERVVDARLHGRIHRLGIGAFEVMPEGQVWEVVHSLLHALRAATLLAMVIGYVGFMLAQFPPTQGLSGDMGAFLLNPVKVIGAGILGSIPSLVFLAVLFLVFRVGLRIVRLFFDAVERRAVKLGRFDPEWAQPTYKFLRVAAIAFALVVAYPYIPGSKSGAFQGVSLFLGILFSLGASSSLANVIAGYTLIYRRAFKVGDRVKIGNSTGDVIETRLQVTHLRTVKNEELIIPNSQILGAEVLNYSSLARARDGLILHAEVGIGYESPWRQVEAMLLAAAERTPGLAKEPRPFVHLLKLGDFAVTYEVNAYCSDVQSMNELYALLYRNILDLFNEHGVQIMTPAYEGDPEQPKVVAPGDWYLPPAAKPVPVGSAR
jgi:small-conductance mechanosensitive channel